VGGWGGTEWGPTGAGRGIQMLSTSIDLCKVHRSGGCLPLSPLWAGGDGVWWGSWSAPESHSRRNGTGGAMLGAKWGPEQVFWRATGTAHACDWSLPALTSKKVAAKPSPLASSFLLTS